MPLRNCSKPTAPFLAVLTMLLFCGGCTNLRQWHRNGFKVGPNYGRPRAPVAGDWIDAADARIQSQRSLDGAWWTVFDDPTLSGLVDSAYRQNLDLRAAGTRILEARAQLGIAAGNLFPQSQQALAAYVHGQFSKTFPLPLGMFNLWATGFYSSWELDFWGRYRRSIIAADAKLGGSQADYNNALVLLLADVATNYVQVRTFQQRLQFARRNVEIQQGSLDLADARFKNGATTELDVQQARSNLAQTQSLIPPLESGQRQAANRLCTLLGLPPYDLAATLDERPIPVAPAEVGLGIPAELLRRRPDVRSAERQVAAQSEQIGIAASDLYPRFGINGFIGYTGDNFRELFAGKSFTGIILPAFQWNILNYGRIRNNVRVQEARFRGAVLQYQQTVLNAGREVEDALVAFVQAQEQAKRLEESVTAAERSVELVLAQYQGGITDFNRVFNTQALLVQQQDQLALARGNIAINLIAVYRALGGGWENFAGHRGPPPAAPPAVPAAPPENLPAAPAEK